MSSTDASVTANGAPDYFPSSASLRAAHGELVQGRRDSGDTPEFLDDVASFIRRGRATGVLLDSNEDRKASQSLLDYWANTLYRAGREPPDATLAEFDPALAPELDDAQCPYLGLDAFREADHDVFFGRQRLVEEMVSRLKENRLLAVVGPSGSGKSSLVLAGFLPTLKAGAVPDSQDWYYYPPMVPGSNPLANLARLLRPADVDAAEWDRQQVERFQQDSDHLSRLVSKGVPTVLVVDQFEELFTLCLDDNVRQTFVDNLLGLIQSPDARSAASPVERHTVILTMRADFEPHVALLPVFQPLFEEAQVRVTPLNAGELREAIEGPAKLVGLKFEEGVVDAFLQDILGEPAALPLLQFTLLKLWENRERNRVTWEGYRRLGGGRLTLAHSADEFYDNLIPEEQVTARRILLRMVRPGDGLEVTSNRVRRETLYQAGEARDRIDRVLDRLIQTRLVRLTEGETPADDQVEVAHEALVRNWPRLVNWLEDEREHMRRRLRLTVAAEQWEALGRDSGALLRGSLLDEALRYRDLSELEAGFVRASQAAIETEYEKEIARQRELARAQALAEAERQRAEDQARAASRLRRLVAALVAVFLLAVGAAVYAVIQQQRAQIETNARATEVVMRSTAEANARENAQFAATRAAEASAAQATAQTERDRALRASLARNLSLLEAQAERDRAEHHLRLSTSRELAAVAVDNLDVDPERSILLALEAVSVTYSVDKSVTYQAENALHQAVQASRVRLAISTSQAWGIAFNPDGTRLATAGVDGMARVWDTTSGQELLTLSSHTGQVWGVAFSPDGTRLATASADGTAKVWDATSGQELLTLSGHTGAVWGVTFSSDGTRLTTTSGDETAKVWNVAFGQELLTLSGHTDWIRSVAFSPDGTRLATASADGTARVWDTASGKELLTLSDHTGAVWGVAFGPDGTRLATASADGTARVWDTASGKELLTISGPAIAVSSVAFSPDGAHLAVARWKTAKVWDASSGQELLALSGHTDAILAIAFSPDGTSLATTGEDGTARVWNISVSQELLTLSSHTDRVKDVAFSPDGMRLATASADETAKVWDAVSGQELFTLAGHNDWVEDIAFSPDGMYLATASMDGTAKVWDATLGQELLTLSGHTNWVAGIAFSPDGMRLATASADETAKVWDAASGQELLTLSGHNGMVWSIAFSPDGTRLATASEDGTAKVWDAASGQELLTLFGHSGWVRDIAFSPDGTCLATASEDETAKVWDAASGQELLTLFGHNDWVRGVAFSLDGMRLATASGDGTAKVWNAYSPYLARRLSHTGSGVEMVKVWNTVPGKELLTLTGHTDWVRSVAFSPDGTRLATASEDGTVRVYTLNIAELMMLACSRVTRNLTQDEWETYLGHDVPYRQTCPNRRMP